MDHFVNTVACKTSSSIVCALTIALCVVGLRLRPALTTAEAISMHTLNAVACVASATLALGSVMDDQRVEDGSVVVSLVGMLLSGIKAASSVVAALLWLYGGAAEGQHRLSVGAWIQRRWQRIDELHGSHGGHEEAGGKGAAFTEEMSDIPLPLLLHQLDDDCMWENGSREGRTLHSEGASCFPHATVNAEGSRPSGDIAAAVVDSVMDDERAELHLSDDDMHDETFDALKKRQEEQDRSGRGLLVGPDESDPDACVNDLLRSTMT